MQSEQLLTAVCVSKDRYIGQLDASSPTISPPSSPTISPPPFPPILSSLSSAPVVLVFLCGGQYVSNQAGANSFVAISESEPLTFLQNHRLAQREGQRCVFTWHHHVLLERRRR